MQAPAQITYNVIRGHLHMIEENPCQGKKSEQYRNALAKLEKAEKELLAWGQTMIHSDLPTIEALDTATKQQFIDKIMQIR